MGALSNAVFVVIACCLAGSDAATSCGLMTCPVLGLTGEYCCLVNSSPMSGFCCTFENYVENRTGLTIGAIIGIVIAILVAVVLLCVLLCCCCGCCCFRNRKVRIRRVEVHN